MRAPTETKWQCPVCGDVIPIPLTTSSSRRTMTLYVDLAPVDLVEVMTHAWTHVDET